MINYFSVRVAHFNLWYVCHALCPWGLFKVVGYFEKKALYGV